MRRIIQEIEAGRLERAGLIAVSGIRTPADVTTMRKRYGEDFLLVYVQVDDESIRFERTQQRGEVRDPESYAEFTEHDRAEEEQFHLSETIAQADVTIPNEHSFEAFHRQIEKRLVRPMLKEETG